MSRRYTKRSRLEYTPELSEVLPAGRYERLWFEDGNIILEAEKTQLRVHKSVLSKHSEVFRGMFGLTQLQGDVDIDGIAFVHLPDKAYDIRIALDWMYQSDPE